MVCVSVFPVIGAMFFIFIAMSGCKTRDVVTQLGVNVGAVTGILSTSQAQSVAKTVTAVAKIFEDFTPEQEYYMGRAVGAVVLEGCRPYDNAKANAYVLTVELVAHPGQVVGVTLQAVEYLGEEQQG